MRKSCLPGLVSGLMLLSTVGVGFGSATVHLNDGWRFSLEMSGEPSKPDFDDHAWPSVVLPNNAKDISDELPRSTRSVWFRKVFEGPVVPQGGQAILQIDDVRSVEVWLNGQHVGKSEEDRFFFSVDVSSLLTLGKNTLALRATVPGISGGVRLQLLPAIHFQPDTLLVDVPGWQGGPASVRVRASVANTSPKNTSSVLSVTVLDDGGRRLAAFKSEPKSLGSGQTYEASLASNPIPDPPIWSVDTPRLCRVRFELQSDGVTVQEEEVLFGFRWFRIDAEKGFFLNGKPLKLRGTVYTKTAPGPFPDRQAMWKQEVGLLKGMGINFVRPAEGGIGISFLDVCDRAGLLATVQVDAEGKIGSLEENLRRRVYRLYNSPSIISWNYNGEGKSAGVARMQSEAARILRILDPQRSAFCVELGWRSPGTVGITDADVAGQGNYTGWYEGTLDHIGPYIDEYRDLVKERYGRLLPIVVSNYGAAADWRVHTDDPRRNDYSEEYFTAFHRRFEREISTRSWLAGGLIFVFRDIDGGQAVPRHTWKGVVDLREQKRDAYYYYQSVWTESPMVHIAQQAWSPRDVWPKGSVRTFEVFSNCPSVEFFHNGESLGIRTKAQGYSWSVNLQPGANSLKALGKSGAAEVQDAALIQVRVRPPEVEARLLPKAGGWLELAWTSIPGVSQYAVYGSSKPGFSLDKTTLVATTSENPYRIKPASYGFYCRVAAWVDNEPGPPSAELGWAPGGLQWRFLNSGWLLSSPALADLNGDGKLEIIIGSYNGKVYALSARGDLLWEFDTQNTVFSSAAVASLRRGTLPSVVINSSHALFVLSANGELQWKYEGIRQYDRNTKSPAVGDLDGDGNAEIVLASDKGELIAFSYDGRLRWRYSTAGPGNRGLGLATPVIVNQAGAGKAIAVGADDGCIYLLSADGKLLWKRDTGIGDAFPGPVPSTFTVAAAPLGPGGSDCVLAGVRQLQAIALDGRPLWERRGVAGVPQVSRLSAAGKFQVVTASGRRLQVIDEAGDPVWDYTLPQSNDFFTHCPVTADLDADMAPDLLAGTRSTYVMAFSSRGQILWKFKTDDELSSSPAVADLQGDGYADVVLASRDGCLYVIGADAVTPEAVRALQFRGGPDRRGDYSGK